MGKGHSVFISYSRQQLYFAEALSLQLQKVGVEVWMDLQQLEPGSDWQAQISAALQACTALVLVGSQPALTSHYVEQEWKTVLAAGKPVYIALYEAVDLPDALESAPVIDFRGRFKPAAKTLADCLLHERIIRQPIPKPNRLHIPTRLPPGIRLIVLALILGAFLTPPLLVDSFPPVFPPLFLFIDGLMMSVLLLWWAWRFLHHRFRLQTATVPLMLPFVIYGFYRMSDAFQNDFGMDLFGEWIGLIVVAILSYLILFWILGPELLRWSAPGDEEIQFLRRWFNKPARRKNRKATKALLKDTLAARAVQPSKTSVIDTPRRKFAFVPELETAGPATYTLHHAREDRPVATSLRRALNGQKLREVDQNGAVHILILSQYLPRVTLQELLEAPIRKVLILVDNVNLQGDAILGQAERLQLIDYRDRSGKILNALARTLRDLTASNLPTSIEITPKSFREIVLPLGTRQIGAWVLSVGVYLFLAGLVTLILGLPGLRPFSLLDLPGLLIGPVLIRQGAAFWGRRTSGATFIPAFAFSAWLSISMFFLAFFLFSSGLPDDPLSWALTPSRLLDLNESFPLICFLPFTFFLVPVALWNYFARYKNWLPAPVLRAKGRDCLRPLSDQHAGRWVLLGWLVGAFLVFGLPLAMYAIYAFLLRVVRFPSI